MSLAVISAISPYRCPDPGPPQIIESIKVDRNLISCLLQNIKHVKIVNVMDCAEYKKAFKPFVKEYHCLGQGRPARQNMKCMIPGKK